MKVQRRCDPKEVYEVMEESATHYIIDRGCNDIALRKKDYEPVEEWVDVDMSTLTFKESEDDAYLCDGVLILFKRTWWANGKGMSDSGEDAETYRITGLQRKVKR
jgi:hypothetical protein